MLHPDNLHSLQTSECTEYKHDTQFRRRQIMRPNGMYFGVPDLYKRSLISGQKGLTYLWPAIFLTKTVH